MRLVLGVDTWGLVGGSERYAGAVASELAARGHDVTVLCARRAGSSPAGGEVVELAAFGDPGGPAAAVTAQVSALRPDAALILSCASPAAFSGVLAAAPTVRFVQDHTLFCPGLNKTLGNGRPCRRPMGGACLEQFLAHDGCLGFRRDARTPSAFAALGALRKHLARLEEASRCARLLVASDYMRRELVAAGAPAGRIAVVPYFTLSASERQPQGELDEATRAFLGRGPEPLVLAAARLVHPDKGIDHLLTALGKLRRPFRAVIAGQGPAEPWLRRKARDEGLADRVRFAGWQPAGALERLLARSSVVAFPSVWDEPFGLVGLEAMAHARPVVAYDVGGVREWLADGVTGRLAPRGDTDALARALDELLADSAGAERMGAAGRERALRLFSVERGVARIEHELERAARGGRATAA
jgi:glycosyltransferase involved in cell wall biosynthesis